MPNHATITLIGHLGKDPVQRPAGAKQVVNFSIAHTRKRQNNETTTWYDVSVWSEKTAAAVMEYAKKGDAIMVQGDVFQDTYQAGDGTLKTALRVDAQSVTFLGGRAKQDGERPKDKAQVAQAAAAGGDEPPF
jgi:single-strand DNA-binding protein